jgi:hypothetical protein
MSTATIPAGFGAVEGEDFTTAVLGPVAEGRPGTMVPVEAPVESPVDEPATIPAPPHPAIGTIEDRVKRGALLLDATTPGWSEKINGDTLAMRWCDKCLLGQLYGDYNGGLNKIGLPLYFGLGTKSKETDEAEEIAAMHGFTITDEEYRMDKREFAWAALADAWRVEIRSRRPEGRGCRRAGAESQGNTAKRGGRTS